MPGIDEKYSRYAMSIKLGFADGDGYSLFRIVPGDEFVANFASDRTHMVRHAQDKAEDVDQPAVSLQEGASKFTHPPPNYPPILGENAAKKGVKMNLMSSFVCMEDAEGTFGQVLDVGEMMWFVTA